MSHAAFGSQEDPVVVPHWLSRRIGFHLSKKGWYTTMQPKEVIVYEKD